ncbi:MAG: hypothetical protein JWR15_107, partial [Prosthecobacter sp.]|nr:hypothetical protein [Prosthecobacter sp.]
MARHVPDDFSFLPTVDSTDEDVFEGEEQVSSKQSPPQPEKRAPHYEAVADPVPAEGPTHQEVPVVVPTPPPRAQVPLPAKMERVLEPEADHPVPASPKAERSVQALPEVSGFSSTKLLPPKEPPAAPKMKDEAPLPTPRAPQPVRLRDAKHSSPVAAVTPSVSFGGAAAAKKSKEPAGDNPMQGGADVSSEKPKKSAEAKADKEPKPFVAPKPAPEEPLDPDEIKKRRWQKIVEKVGLRTLGLSVGVHLFLLLIAAFIGVSHVMERQVDF